MDTPQRPMTTITLIVSLMLTLGIVFLTGILASQLEVRLESYSED
jgi:hypothetical protein